ncbi:DUF1446 domain-containing protein [Microbacterium resistens]|uniref:acyclic terpene utilization AtuA family protein n=1 Tax=Microbacterium resistens TaxID=156977 RepID=UPI001C598C77|nr:acyclic terpene utilization AtuA family protein [Microbacterium resistens]MBW1638089.1 DUF1446 domain-containing protein [Microbacterium resistens]
MTASSPDFRIGVGAGFSGDRFDAAERLARDGALGALVFETLAERSIALAQDSLRSGSGEGFDPRLLRRMSGTLGPVLGQGGVIITNGGAANPVGAARAVRSIAAERGHPDASVVAVTGDDVRDVLDLDDSVIIGTDRPLSDLADRIVSAHAYTGAETLMAALTGGADVVIAGRTSDPALFLAPLAVHHGWNLERDDPFIAAGLLTGHLLECAGQLSGGYFADGGRKTVPDLAHLGFPFADVGADGRVTLRKLAGTGGRIDSRTVIEQLLYEIDDPHAYVTPDGTLDLTEVRVDDLGDDVVSVTGARLSGRPRQLKVSVGVNDGFRSAAGISYAGHGALRRARLAEQIIRERWESVHGHDAEHLVVEYMGVNSARHWWHPDGLEEVPEVRLRFGVRALEREVATALCEEVEALYTNGPAGGGGVSAHIASSVGIVSTLIDRDLVSGTVEEVR